MSRFRKKSNFLLKILLLFSCCGCTTLVETQAEDENPVAAPQHGAVVSPPTVTSTHGISSSTPRSILVLKISPNFKTSSSSTTDGDEFIRNINRRLEGYKKFVAEYDASRNNAPGGINNNNGGASVNNGAGGNPALRNPHYSFEYPYKPPKEDLDYHTNAILYFIGISIVIAAIGVMSCLCINKSSCHKAVVGQMTANRTANNSNSAGGGRRHNNNNNNLSRGSHATSNLSIITGTTTASSFSASPSVSNANFSASAGGGLNGSSQSFHRGDANFDDTIHVKAIQNFDLPPSYDSLFPTAIETNSVATPNTNTVTDSNSTTSTTNANAATNANDAVTLNVNNLETNKI